MEGRSQVGVDGSAPVRVVKLEELLPHEDTGVVHQDIETAELTESAGDNVIGRSLDGYVSDHGRGLPPRVLEPGGSSGQLLLFARHQQDTGPIGTESRGDRETKPLACPGNNRCFPIKQLRHGAMIRYEG